MLLFKDSAEYADQQQIDFLSFFKLDLVTVFLHLHLCFTQDFPDQKQKKQPADYINYSMLVV